MGRDALNKYDRLKKKLASTEQLQAENDRLRTQMHANQESHGKRYDEVWAQARDARKWAAAWKAKAKAQREKLGDLVADAWMEGDAF